jgi:hypothetical protein
MPMTHYPGADDEGEPVGHRQEDAEARLDRLWQRLLDLERRCTDLQRKVEAIEQQVYGWRDIAAEVADYLEISRDEVVSR